MDQPSIKGSCLCGATAFAIEPPYVFFHYCHCGRCRKSSGTVHSANLLVKAEQFRWIRGGEEVGRWELPEAQYFCTGFCPTCGSPMPWMSRNGRGYIVPAGALDDDPQARPQHNIFWESRTNWFTETSDLEKCPEGRPRR